MQSYLQYRAIGEQVRKELGRKDSVSPERQPLLENGRGSQLAQRRIPGLRPEQDEDDNQHPSSNGQQSDKIIVDTAGEDDPMDPKNWPLSSRTKNIAVLALLIFVQAWAGAAESIANSVSSEEFGISQVAENLSTAIYLFGLGSGAMLAGPISETVGRNPTYLVATFCYLFFVAGSALTPTFVGQVVTRYFVGLFASATLAINGSSVRDQFRPVKRAFVFPIIAWANVAAPALAPVAGGWITSAPGYGWRWTEWNTLIISTIGFLVSFLFLPETHLPVLLQWKAEHLRKITGDDRYVSEHEQSTLRDRVKNTLPLPATFFRSEPVIVILGSYLILLYILLFTFLSGFDYIFKQTYDLSTGLEGSCFAAVAAGATTFLFTAPALYTWARHRVEGKRGASVPPEFRLWPAIVISPLLPVSLFWLGWTNDPSISIWSGLGACFVFGVVLIAIYVSSYEYIIDSYGDNSSVALASITMARYLIAGGMVMAARLMYEGIGVQWTMTLLGCIAVFLAPAPLAFWWYGKQSREKSPYARSDEDLK